MAQRAAPLGELVGHWPIHSERANLLFVLGEFGFAYVDHMIECNRVDHPVSAQAIMDGVRISLPYELDNPDIPSVAALGLRGVQHDRELVQVFGEGNLVRAELLLGYDVDELVASQAQLQHQGLVKHVI